MGLAGQSGGGGQLVKLDMGLAGKSGGGGQLCKRNLGLAGQKWEFTKEVEVHSKVFVMASKCVSGDDFCVSFILSEEISPSHKIIFKMNKRTSPNGGREELRSPRTDVGSQS